MKNLKVISKVAFVLSVLSISFISCKPTPEPEKIPDYVGTWIKTDSSTVVADLKIYSVDTTKLVLTKTTFGMETVAAIPKICNYKNTISGLFSVTADKFTSQINQLIVPDSTLNTSIQSSIMSFFTTGNYSKIDVKYSTLVKGTPQFDAYINEYLDKKSTIEGVYTVSNNKLTMKVDSNGNGTFENNEIEIYTKK